MRISCFRRTAARLLPVICAVLLAASLVGNARAVSAVTAQLRPDLTVMIDGSARTFYAANGQEVHPVLWNGTTYLPVRAIGELMGKNVDWNQTTKTVTLSGKRTTPAAAGKPDTAAAVQEIAADLRDDFTVVVDGAVRAFADAGGNPVYPLLYNGSTYLPVRAIGELMGKSVNWNQETKTVTLSGGVDVTDADTFSGDPAPVNGPITLEEAKTKALQQAGLTADAVTFTKQKLDREDGRQVYDLEFFTAGGQEYDFEIDAASGEIRSFDYEGRVPNDGTGQPVTLEQARDLALAKVPGAAVEHVVKLKQDREDGRQIYEVEILCSGMEYDVEIDAATGTILQFDSEPAGD